jgi:hypothetical protein
VATLHIALRIRSSEQQNRHLIRLPDYQLDSKWRLLALGCEERSNILQIRITQTPPATSLMRKVSKFVDKPSLYVMKLAFRIPCAPILHHKPSSPCFTLHGMLDVFVCERPVEQSKVLRDFLLNMIEAQFHSIFMYWATREYCHLCWFQAPRRVISPF